MVIAEKLTGINIKHPINLNSKDFINNKQAIYKWLRDESPVYKGKVSVIGLYMVSRYEDCVMVLKDPRFIRNRTTATGGGGRVPFPTPKSVKLLMESMILEDDPEHRRLRNLVHKAFTPKNIRQLGEQVETLSHELLDKADKHSAWNLQKEFALRIPVAVIAGMMGVPEEEMDIFSGGMKALTDGMTGFNILRTFIWDIPKMTKFVRELVERKRANPQDDILTALIQAEEDGETLSEEELISMVYLLIIAGYETTVHLITNAVLTLIQYPEQLTMIRENPDLMDSAIEELLRFQGPIEGTKMVYPIEDVTLHGVTIPKGKAIMPLLGAANRDERQFENPDVFDITRSPNRHLGFGQGIHYCLGAPLARLETKLALNILFERFPNIRLAVDPAELKLQKVPGWHRYENLPVILD